MSNNGIYHVDRSCPYHGVHLSECRTPDTCRLRHYRFTKKGKIREVPAEG